MYLDRDIPENADVIRMNSAEINSEEVNEYYDFAVIPGFKTPYWAKGAVMYQIYTVRFGWKPSLRSSSIHSITAIRWFFISIAPLPQINSPSL